MFGAKTPLTVSAFDADGGPHLPRPSPTTFPGDRAPAEALAVAGPGSNVDNRDMRRAFPNAPKPTRTEVKMLTNISEPLITEGEAAGILRVSVTSLRRWRRQGAGPMFRKLGRTVRYRPNDLSDFVASAGRMSTSRREA